MFRLLFFTLLVVLSIVMILPFRYSAIEKNGISHGAVLEEKCLAAKKDLTRCKRSGDSNACDTASLNLAKVLVELHRYKEADRIYQNVWKRRQSFNSDYDDIYMSAVMGLASLRRDTASDGSSVSCYETVLAYDKNRLAPDDTRIARDQINLAVALSLFADGVQDKNKKSQYLKRSAALLLEAIEQTRRAKTNGSFREANARQTLSYVLKGLGDKSGYRSELRNAREMQRMHFAFQHCEEP